MLPASAAGVPQAIYWLSHQALKHDAVRKPWVGELQPGRLVQPPRTRSRSKQAQGDAPSQQQQQQSSSVQLRASLHLSKQASGGNTPDVASTQDQNVRRDGVQLPPGTTVNISQPLGRGVCGTVYKGWRWALQCLVSCGAAHTAAVMTPTIFKLQGMQHLLGAIPAQRDA